MKCAQWILNLQFFINFSLSSKSFAKKLKNFNVNARVRWNGVNQFRAHTHIEFEYGSCVAEKRISHCEYHSLWHARYVTERMTHTWRYTFITKFLASAFSISYMPTIKIGVYRNCIRNEKSFVCWIHLNNNTTFSQKFSHSDKVNRGNVVNWLAKWTEKMVLQRNNVKNGRFLIYRLKSTDITMSSVHMFWPNKNNLHKRRDGCVAEY